MTSVAIAFDSVTLVNPEPLKPKKGIYSFEITIECHTDDFADITALIAKTPTEMPTKTLLLSGKVMIQTLTGTKGTLVITGGDLAGSYTNCVIMGPFEIKEVEGTGGTWWQYSPTFAQETK